LRQEEAGLNPRGSALRSWAPLAVIMILLVGGEVICRAVVAPTRLDLILNLLERDPLLLWRLRADLDTQFEHARVRTNKFHVRGPAFAAAKTPARMRVVCLGASPTFGWGVNEESAYPAVVARLLARQGINAEVINGGVPGYTSWQGMHFLERDVLAWSPDAVTVAYDLNDLDVFRFFRNDGRPDSAQKPESAAVVVVQNRLNRSVLYGLFRRTLISALSSGGAFDPTRLPRRVSVEEYRKNLLSIERLCRARGVRLVFLKMPVNLPFYRLEKRDPDRARLERRLGDEAVDRGDWPAAKTHYEKSNELDPTVVETYGALAQALRRVGQDDRAQSVLSMIPFAAAFSDRIDRQYNAGAEEVARSTQRPCVDVVAAFAQDGRGEALWNSREDPFHPNAEGHAIIAKLTSETLATMLRTSE